MANFSIILNNANCIHKQPKYIGQHLRALPLLLLILFNQYLINSRHFFHINFKFNWNRKIYCSFVTGLHNAALDKGKNVDMDFDLPNWPPAYWQT